SESISATCPTVKSGTFSSSNGSMCTSSSSTRLQLSGMMLSGQRSIALRWPLLAAQPTTVVTADFLGRELLGLALDADRDLARLGLLQDRDADLQHAVVLAGLDRLGVQVVREPD